jgi:alkylated DNA repair dioxygenase AlkB
MPDPSRPRGHGLSGTTGRVSAVVQWQPSLFGSGSVEVDDSFAGITRTWLDPVSWVDHCPGWLRGSDGAFAELARNVAWDQRIRWMYDREVDEPRLTAWQRVDVANPLRQPFLQDARTALSKRYEVEFDSVSINLYRDGADSVAWHRDRIPTEIVDPVVALISVGEPRKFLLRPFGGGSSCVFKLGHGDLFVTGGQTQRRYEHCVPKVASSGPRISLAFRHGVNERKSQT